MTISMDAQAQASMPGLGLGSGLPSFGMAMRFTVKVDGLDLGQWSACKGLKVDFKVTKLPRGGDYASEHILPDRISYSPVTLERAMETSDSAAVRQWLQHVASDWTTDDGSTVPGRTATITLYDVSGQTVASWTLQNVYPSSWSGPSLNGSENNVAIETLVLEHEGFL